MFPLQEKCSVWQRKTYRSQCECQTRGEKEALEASPEEAPMEPGEKVLPAEFKGLSLPWEVGSFCTLNSSHLWAPESPMLMFTCTNTYTSYGQAKVTAADKSLCSLISIPWDQRIFQMSFSGKVNSLELDVMIFGLGISLIWHCKLGVWLWS